MWCTKRPGGTKSSTEAVKIVSINTHEVKQGDPSQIISSHNTTEDDPDLDITKWQCHESDSPITIEVKGSSFSGKNQLSGA